MYNIRTYIRKKDLCSLKKHKRFVASLKIFHTSFEM